MFNTRRYFTLGILLALTATGLILYKSQQTNLQLTKESVLGVDDVVVSARVGGCNLEFTILPEKRIPSVGNWSNLVHVEMHRPDNTYFTDFDITTDNNGHAVIDLCQAQGVSPEPGNFDYYIYGFSHLRRAFLDRPSFSGPTTNHNFSQDGTLLLAGEMSNTFDNKVNSLDLSIQMRNLFTNDVKSDLNRDGEVNSLDVSNTAVNLFSVGDSM